MFPHSKRGTKLHELLKTTREKILFGLLIVSVLLGLAGARLAIAWLARTPKQTLGNVIATLPMPILDNLIAGLISAAVIFLLYGLLGSKKPSLDGVQVVEAVKSNIYHHEALRKTRIWWHYGHYAGWVRGEVMPQLAKDGLHRHTEIRIIIIDPRLMELCESYTRFRKSGSTQNLEAKWDTVTIYNEIYSTLLTAQLRRYESNDLIVHIYLRPEFSIYRIDINDDWAAFTCVDPREPPILVAKESPWYDTMKSNFHRLIDYLPEVAFLTDVELSAIAPVDSVDKVTLLMKKLNLPIPSCLSEADQKAVAQVALERWNKGTLIYA